MNTFKHAISKNISGKLFLSALSLALFVFVAGCSGGGSSTPTDSGSTEEKLTSMSQLQGAYKLQSVTTSSGGEQNVESLGIYTVIDPPYYANFGNGGTCFTLSSIVSETVTDAGLEVTFQPQEAIDGVPYCGVYLAANLRSSPRPSGHTERSKAQEVDIDNLPDEQTLYFFDPFADGRADRIILVKDLPTGNAFNYGWVPGEGYPRLSSDAQETFDDFMGWARGVNDNDGETEPAPTEPPSATLTCTDLGHGTGESYLYMCVLYENVPAGTQAKFTVSGGGSVAELTVDVQPSGWACVTGTIYSYGDYSWRAEVETAAGSNTTTGSITVGKEEQKNCTQ